MRFFAENFLEKGITSYKDKGLKGDFIEPAEDLKFDIFANSLKAQVLTYGD